MLRRRRHAGCHRLTGLCSLLPSVKTPGSMHQIAVIAEPAATFTRLGLEIAASLSIGEAFRLLDLTSY